MYTTEYERAASADAAVKSFSEAVSASGDPRFLAGGQTLIPTMKARLAAPSSLIDLGRIEELRRLEVDGRRVRIGAMCTHADVADSAPLREACPSVASLAARIGDPHVRHRGTIGGSIANNDPAADYPAALLALDATIEILIANGETRRTKADEFFTGMFETVLEEGDLVTAVAFEAPDRGHYEKFRNPASRYAIAGVFVADRGGDVRVGVAGAGADGAFRWTEAERALSADFSAGALADLAPDEDGLLSDMHADRDYRANLVAVMARRAVDVAAR